MKLSKAHNLLEFIVKTPIGLLKIKSCEEGLHLISWEPESSKTGDEEGNQHQDGEKAEGLLLDIKNPKLPSDKFHAAVFEWMQEYFGITHSGNPALTSDATNFPKICWEGLEKTEFETKVLQTAYESVKFGGTVSYKQLAEMVGSPGASRAVGTALKNNPIPLIIPCHRIIRADGSLGNYSGGTKNHVKEWLVSFEKED